MPKYQLSIEVNIAEGFGGFQAIESKILEVAREAGRNLMEQIFGDYETFVFGRRPLQKKDLRGKKYETLLGVIPMKRWRAWDVFKGKMVYPLDEWMGLGLRQKVSPGLEAEIVEQCVQRPYAQASKVCSRLSGVKRSVTSNWNLVQGFSKRKQDRQPLLTAWKGKALPVLLPHVADPCPILGVDPDATYVRPRRKTDTNHELKMAVIYTHRKKQGKNRWVLGGKQVVLGLVRGSAAALFNRVTEVAVTEYGLHSDSRVVVHGDGGARMMWSEEGLNNLSFLREKYLNRSYDFKKVTVPQEHYRQISYADELRDVARDL